MKKLLKYVALAIALIACACNDDDNPAPDPGFAVNYANIAGVWQLTEWNGEPVNDTRYCYMIITRKADEETGRRPMEVYQNLDSSKSRYLTSTYELTEDEDLGVVISGLYDHSSGFWNRDYIVGDLTAGSMVWTVTDDPADVSVYTRCEAVPEDILNGTRALE